MAHRRRRNERRLTASQVDARIAAEVADFAEEGNTADDLPYSKLPQRLIDTLLLREQVTFGFESLILDIISSRPRIC